MVDEGVAEAVEAAVDAFGGAAGAHGDDVVDLARGGVEFALSQAGGGVERH
ncbi:hypothetical protein ACIBCM_23425 [Streptomyces sp. NPDC051018]|uniref:hypothetical protein n=1 Tax=Streptomyces sp. NPDC051018 TaxID=3365639 RepID=UPI0037B11440